MIHWKEHPQACEALIYWLESQQIEPLDAVPILVMAIRCAIISTSSNAARIKEAQEIAARMIKDPLPPSPT